MRTPSTAAAIATVGLISSGTEYCIVTSFSPAVVPFVARPGKNKVYRRHATTTSTKKNDSKTLPLATSAADVTETASIATEHKKPVSFIDTELRGAAMKLHTRSQAPREGQAEEKKMEPHVTTLDDYMAFLVDSQHVYQAFENVINDADELSVFRNSPLDRVERLETDIKFIENEYDIRRPAVGKAGSDYAEVIRQLGNDIGKSLPEFMCHYYNFYFAHTAGGRMIGRKMSSMLLNKKTLEFYKWDGDLNKIKEAVKGNIEDIVAKWSVEEKKKCTDATAAAFKGGGALNGHLSGGQNPH